MIAPVSEYICEEQKLRNMLRDSVTDKVLTDKHLIDVLENLPSPEPYQFDLDERNRIILRLP